MCRVSPPRLLQPSPLHRDPAQIRIGQLFEHGRADIKIGSFAAGTWYTISTNSLNKNRVDQYGLEYLHLSITVTSMLASLPVLSLIRWARIFLPQNELVLGLAPTWFLSPFESTILVDMPRCSRGNKTYKGCGTRPRLRHHHRESDHMRQGPGCNRSSRPRKFASLQVEVGQYHYHTELATTKKAGLSKGNLLGLARQTNCKTYDECQKKDEGSADNDKECTAADAIIEISFVWWEKVI